MAEPALKRSYTTAPMGTVTPLPTMTTQTHGETGRENHQAFQILYVAFVLAPLLAGLDKFAYVLTDWTQYLAPVLPRMLGMTAPGFMKLVGVIEIVAAIGVLVRPRVFSYVVAGWLAGIIVNLLVLGQYFDVALRDFGLCLAAIAFARLSQIHDVSWTRTREPDLG